MKTITDGGVKLKMVRAVMSCRGCWYSGRPFVNCPKTSSKYTAHTSCTDGGADVLRIWIPATWRVAKKGAK